MNRRSLVAGAAALLPATALSQATPVADSTVDVSAVLRTYVDRVFNDRDVMAVPELFSEDHTNVYEEYRRHAEIVERLDSAFAYPFRLLDVATNGAIAMGHGWLYLSGEPRRDAFVLIEVGTDGLILRSLIVWDR